MSEPRNEGKDRVEGGSHNGCKDDHSGATERRVVGPFEIARRRFGIDNRSGFAYGTMAGWETAQIVGVSAGRNRGPIESEPFCGA